MRQIYYSLLYFCIFLAQSSGLELISVEALGQVRTEAQEVLVTFELFASNDTAAQTSAQIEALVSNLTLFLTDNGVLESDIPSFYPYFDPVVSETQIFGITTPTSFESTRPFQFTLRNLRRFDTIASNLFNQGFLIENFNFQVPNQNVYLAQSRSLAAKNATRIANEFAKALNASLGGIKVIKQSDYVVPSTGRGSDILKFNRELIFYSKFQVTYFVSLDEK